MLSASPTPSLLLYRTTHDAVRTYLSQKHPQLFSVPAMQNVASYVMSSTRRSAGDGSAKSSETALKTLAALNGYTKVSKIQCPVSLAEGVQAVQRGKLMERYTVYSRECRRDPPPPTPKPVITSISAETYNNIKLQPYLPPFREEDFTLYRDLENRLDSYLNNKKEALFTYVRGNLFVKLMQKIATQIMPPKTESESDSSIESLSDEEQSDVLCAESNSQVSLEQYEDILISYQGNLVALEQVPPEYRLLALPPIMTRNSQLPYKLKHNTASTIIYVSFATFVALPLAYRSVKYALDYPALVEALLASFFGTLAYSVWYSRYGARVRQQLSIEKAVGSRIVARNDAAMSLLVEGALTNITHLVLAEKGVVLSDIDKTVLQITSPNDQDAAGMLKTLKELNLNMSEMSQCVEYSQRNQA